MQRGSYIDNPGAVIGIYSMLIFSTHNTRSKSVSNIIKRFMKEESGATMVEYALLVALIAIAAIATITILSDKLNAKFNEVAACLEDKTKCPGYVAPTN